MSGIVKYNNNRRFNVGQALKDGWGLEWQGEEALHGLNLQDRKNAKIKCTILKTDWFMGIFRVFFVDGEWQCFDHCIEQFKLDQ